MLSQTTPKNQTTPAPLYLHPPSSKMNQQKKEEEGISRPLRTTEETRKGVLLPPPRRTHVVVWCAAVFCIIFSILLILTGIVIIIVFLVIKPKHPSFDTTGASLNSIYLDTPEYFNGDLIILANFSNPNRKIDVRFEFLSIELYFFDKLIAVQSVQPFPQRRGEARVESVHMISSEVYLPLNLSLALQKQVQSNRIQYNIRGTFRVRASVGLTHFSYWLYGRCRIELTGPPGGILVTRSCHTRK
eukprot:TRINITY_DN93784_c0_g1_i1.p1 TRINITY_DN93784_c0_g1~~TRINITY_DN93784_c0_g1_i1.p1  ORF type:complete len:244 (-),score=28.67 TRINITY_DN93784_c0_g1_i1:122-853(-)